MYMASLKSWTLSVPGKDIRACQDENCKCYYSIDDVCEALSLSRTYAHELLEWGCVCPITTDSGEKIWCVKSESMPKLILASRNLEARAHFYRKTRGVNFMTDSFGRTSFDTVDAAICLGYENPKQAVREHLWGKSRSGEHGIHRLAVASPLPDAEEFEQELYDEARLTYIWCHMKYGPEWNCIIPFNYKGVTICTFAEGEDGDFLFSLDDVCVALGIKKAPPLGRGKGLRKTRVLDFDSYFGKLKGTVVTEEGLDRLLERCDSPEVGDFRRWVESKVLPSLKQPHPWGRPERVIVK